MKLSYMEMMYINGSLKERKVEIGDEIDLWLDGCVDDETQKMIDGLNEEYQMARCIVNKITVILSQG